MSPQVDRDLKIFETTKNKCEYILKKESKDPSLYSNRDREWHFVRWHIDVELEEPLYLNLIQRLSNMKEDM